MADDNKKFQMAISVPAPAVGRKPIEVRAWRLWLEKTGRSAAASPDARQVNSTPALSRQPS